MKSPEWWRQTLIMNPVKSGAVVNFDTALTVSAVWSAVRIIAETIASLPLHVYERQEKGKKIAYNHPLNQVLSVLPNDEQTTVELLEFVLSNLLMRGTGYCEKVHNSRGVVIGLEPLYTKFMYPDRDLSGQLVFDYQETGNARVYMGDHLWRTAGLGSNGVTGHSPISLGRESLGVALSAEEQAAKLFSNGLQPSVLFEKDGVLSDTAFERLKNELKEKSGSANAYEAMILEDSLKANQIGFTAEDSQFLESRKFQIAEVARWFRVPLHMLAELDKSTNNNIEHQSIEFVMHTIRPWVKRLEASMLRDLFTPSQRAQHFTEFKIDGLLRGDIKSRYEAYGKAINDGWMNRNEARQFENMNSEDGLDEFLVPLNMRDASDTDPEDDPDAQAAVVREVVAVRTEHKRLDAKAFKEWASNYYPRLADRLVEDGFSISAVSAYCAAHFSAITAPQVDIEQLLNHWQKTAVKDLYHA